MLADEGTPVKCGSLLIIRPRPEVCVRVLGAWREQSLTDWEGQGEQSQWRSLERKLKGCTNDHRLRESISRFRNSIYKGMKMQGVSW